MVKAYQCPYAYRTRHFNGVMCSLLMDRNNHSYADPHECVQALCAFGYFCRQSNRWEVNPHGRDCIVKERKEGSGNG